MRRAAVSALQSERAARDGIPALDLFAEEKSRARMAGAVVRADAGARAHERTARAPPPLLPGTSIHDSYRMGKLIGKGGFGSVYRAVHIESGRKVAIKVPHQSNNAAEFAAAEFAAEVGMLQHCDHPNIVRFLEVIWSEGGGSVYLVQELVTGGSLSDYLAARGKPLCEREAGALTKDLLSGLQYLHSLAIIHRDIKPANLLLQTDAERIALKISDFGLSTQNSDEAARRTLCGTPEYLAPEVIRTAAPRDGKTAVAGYSLPSDMWSAGCVVYTMLCMRPPFRADSMQSLFGAILAAKVAFGGEHGGGLSSMARDLIMHLLVVAPEGRYSATDALTHPWMDPEDDDEQPGCKPPHPVAARPSADGDARAPSPSAEPAAHSPPPPPPHVGKPPRPAPASPRAELVVATSRSRRTSAEQTVVRMPEQARLAEQAQSTELPFKAPAGAPPQPAEPRSPLAPSPRARASLVRSHGASPLRSWAQGLRAHAPLARTLGTRASRVSAPTPRLLSYPPKASVEPAPRPRGDHLAGQAYGAVAPRPASRAASPGAGRLSADAGGAGGAGVWDRLAHETTQSLRLARFARHSCAGGGLGAAAQGGRHSECSSSRRSSASDSACGEGSRPDSPLAARPHARAHADGGAEGGGEQAPPSIARRRPSSGGAVRVGPTALLRPPSGAPPTRRPPLVPPPPSAPLAGSDATPLANRREPAVLQKATASSETRQRQRMLSFSGQGRTAILALRLQHLNDDADAADRQSPSRVQRRSADWALKLGANQQAARSGAPVPASAIRCSVDESTSLAWVDFEGRPQPKGSMAFAHRAATADSAVLSVELPLPSRRQPSSPRVQGQGL